MVELPSNGCQKLKMRWCLGLRECRSLDDRLRGSLRRYLSTAQNLAFLLQERRIQRVGPGHQSARRGKVLSLTLKYRAYSANPLRKSIISSSAIDEVEANDVVSVNLLNVERVAISVGDESASDELLPVIRSEVLQNH